jgi:hypothetical protein
MCPAGVPIEVVERTICSFIVDPFDLRMGFEIEDAGAEGHGGELTRW